MLLLSDGTVMAKGGGNSATSVWYKLTPNGINYISGNWSTLQSSNTARQFYPSNVLPSGKVFVVGGEYTAGDASNSPSFISVAEVYDPVADTWTTVKDFNATGNSNFGDDPTALLPNGNVLAGYYNGTNTYIYSPSANTWTQTSGGKLHNDQSDEETWVKLPDDSILSYDVFGSGASTGKAQRYIPSQDKWVATGTVPVSLSSASVGFELGGALRLPDGRVLYLGGNGNTAYYTPSTDTWAAGPTMPTTTVSGNSVQLVAADAPCAMLPNGHVLMALSPIGTASANGSGYTFPAPTKVYEFDPTAGVASPYTDVTPSITGFGLNISAFKTQMLVLPTGEVLMSNCSGKIAMYQPDGSASSAWRPAITGIAAAASGGFTLTGMQLNGISEGTSYGDDAEMSSNYPILRMTDVAGNPFFARTSNWSSTGVATGSTPVSTQFSLPSGRQPAIYKISAIANGITSPDVLNVEMGSVTTNNITIRVDPNNSSNVQVLAGSTSLASVNMNSIAGLYVSGSSANDSVTITGNFPTLPISVDGGGGTNSLIVNTDNSGQLISDLATQIIFFSGEKINYNLFNVTINGGTGNDALIYGPGDILGMPIVTFNGGAGTDEVFFDNDASTHHWSYYANSVGILANDADTDAFKIVNINSVEQINMTGAAAGENFEIGAITSGMAVTVNGGAGNDELMLGDPTTFPGSVAFSSVLGSVTFQGQGGTDSIVADDRTATANHTYSVTANEDSINSNTSGPIIFDSTTEAVTIYGPSSFSGNFTVSGTASTFTTTLQGGAAADTFNIEGVFLNTFDIAGNVNIDGGGGNDTLTYFEASYTGSIVSSILLSQTDIEPGENAIIRYDHLASLVIDGPPVNETYYILGTSPDISGQTTLLADNGNNTIYVFPHDALGNRTIASSIGIGGQGGTDTLNIADQTFLDPFQYVLSNPHGASTQDIGGMGTLATPGALVGVGSDVENINIGAGDANDTFEVDSFETGAVLSIDGNGGDDVINVTPNSKDLATNVTNIGGFTFDGGDGDNRFNLYNDNSASAWTYTRTSTIFKAQKTSYFLNFALDNVNEIAATGGMLADTFLVQSTPSAYFSSMYFDGEGGNNSYILGNAGNTHSIFSPITLYGGFGGNDSLTIDDSADTIARTFHVDTFTAGSRPGDSLFAPGGSLFFSDIFQSATINCGSGADTVYALPNVSSPLSINGNNPTAAPGDQLTLALAAVPNYVVTPTSASAGHVSGDGVQTLSWTGFEQVTVDDVAPQVTGAIFRLDTDPTMLDVSFNKDMSPFLTISSLELTDVLAAQDVSNGAMSLNYEAADNTAHFTFPGLTGGILPDGVYRARIIVGLTDLAGNALAADFFFNFLLVNDNGNLSVTSDHQFYPIDQLAMGTGGLLDLRDNDLVVHNGDLAGITTQLQSGWNAINGGYWDGPAGILSSTAAGDPTFLTTLGEMQSSGGSFDGMSTLSGDALVKYTYYGDADLNGTVDGADYQQIDLGFGGQLTGWSNGDFNYDGVVDGSDYALIDNAFNQMAATEAGPLAQNAVRQGVAADISPASTHWPGGDVFEKDKNQTWADLVLQALSNRTAERT